MTVARWFDYWNGQPRNEGWFIDQLVFFSSQGREDGKLLDLRAKLVIRQALKWIGRPSSSYTSTTLVLLALAEVDLGEPNLKPDWYAWVSDQISFRLNHTKQDMARSASFGRVGKQSSSSSTHGSSPKWGGKTKKNQEQIHCFWEMSRGTLLATLKHSGMLKGTSWFVRGTN
ncbi:hypothetical protein R1flu_023378 [Riccia fluitans]|uniref:Uncharacterized protein n=1 Tax=Riccia fluitans TaxID=41844 RepID=A0ABD1XUV3_9MARC